MKEMIYGFNRKEEILEQGNYMGYNYKIISYGTHPCAYIEIPKANKLYKKDYNDIDVTCHGGLTFGDFRDFGDGEKYYIGWDYAHCDDCFMSLFGGDGRQYTTEEILDDVKIAIDSILKY